MDIEEYYLAYSQTTLSSLRENNELIAVISLGLSLIAKIMATKQSFTN